MAKKKKIEPRQSILRVSFVLFFAAQLLKLQLVFKLRSGWEVVTDSRGCYCPVVAFILWIV